MSGGSVGLAWRAGAVNIWSTKSYVVSPPVTPPRPENARTCEDLKTRNDQLRQEVALLTEEIRIKDARMKRVDPQKRPHYVPTERMAILELRAARAWSAQQTADAFSVTAATIASWMRRVDEEGANALIQIREPVNKFPDFVRYAVQRLKALCPSLGKTKIAKMLCRAGLHLGTTTVGRILKEPPRAAPPEAAVSSDRVVTAKYPNHVWHVDLTTVPTGAGFWAPWVPFALPQCWPFCWWLAIAIDHYSRCAIGFSVFPKRPKSLAVRTFLGRMIARANATPKYVICDKDSIFWCEGFKRWCRRKRIRPRYGAVGQHGSIAVLERFIRTMKDEATRRILVPQRRTNFRRELEHFFAWYNACRPHTTLEGRTPNEVYFRLRPANRRPRIEPRKRWPRRAPCAGPRTLIAGRPGDRFKLEVDFHGGGTAPADRLAETRGVGDRQQTCRVDSSRRTCESRRPMSRCPLPKQQGSRLRDPSKATLVLMRRRSMSGRAVQSAAQRSLDGYTG